MGATYPTTRDEAKKQGKKFYHTGEPCGHGHLAMRYASSGNCTMCVRSRSDTANLDLVNLERIFIAAIIPKQATPEERKQLYAAVDALSDYLRKRYTPPRSP